jgi:quercetin dioxygenase-like cupin family protein
MKTLSSIFIAIIAIAAAIYNNEYMLSRLTDLSKRIKPLTSNIFNPSRNMSTAGLFRGLPVIPDEPYTTTSPRKIAKSFLAVEQSEGAGARVRRSVGTPQLRNFSPFLMLDHFAIPPGAGFPDHPHRGQETITYLLSGAVDHEDFAGNKGTIEQGDLQFMTARTPTARPTSACSCGSTCPKS